jgi:hypothetical protein
MASQEDKFLCLFLLGGLGVVWIYLSATTLPDALFAGDWGLAGRAALAGAGGVFSCLWALSVFVPRGERDTYGGAKFEDDREEARRSGLE